MLRINEEEKVCDQKKESAKLKHAVNQWIKNDLLESSESSNRGVGDEGVLHCARAGICGKCQIILPCYFLIQPRLPRSMLGSENVVRKLQRNE